MPDRITEPGVYNISSAEYHSDPVVEPSLSASLAWELLNRSPLHCFTKSPRLNPDYVHEEKAIFDLGSAAHNMVLRQDYWREEIRVVDAPDWRTKAARADRDAAHDAGQYPLLRDQYDAIQAMVTVLEQHPHASKAFRDGKPEQTLLCRDASGVWMRCRPDYTPPTHPTTMAWPDYKTTTDARVGRWDARFIRDYGGALRAAHYEHCILAVTGIRPRLYYVVQEVMPPFAIRVVVVEGNSEFMRIGRAMLKRAIRTWAECLKTNTWPSYELITEIAMPAWAETSLAIDYADDMED